MEEGQYGPKWKRLHLDISESVRLSQSEEGTTCLRQPIDRAHPQACADQAMVPRYRSRGRFRPPWRVTSLDQAGGNSESDSAQVSVSGECEEGLQINSNDNLQLVQMMKNKGCRQSNSKTTDSQCVLQQPSSSVGFECRGNFLNENEISSHSSAIERLQNGHPGQENVQSNCEEFEWGSAEEEHEMAEQSNDKAINLLSTLGGFKSAATLHQDSSSPSWHDASSHTSSLPKYSFRGQGGKSGKKQWVRDPSQKSITSFMSHKKDSCVTSPIAYAAASTISDSQGFQPQISSDRVVYGSPSKMYSPVKKVSETVYVISDDSSPEKSQEKLKTSCAQSADANWQNSPAVKKLFTFKSFNQNATQRKEAKRSTVSRSGRTTDKGVKRKKSKHNIGRHQRTLAPSSSTLGLSGIDFDAADDDSFCIVSASVPAVTVNIKVGPTFGLLNDSLVEVVKVNWFERLPQEIVENIFCHLPMVDLCLNISRVCQTWNNIVSSPAFMPWKKLYHKLKKGDKKCQTQLKSVVQQEGMESAKLLKLISYMQSFKPVTRDSKACELLQQHPKYSWAVALLEDRAPHCINNREVNPWSLVCSLVLVSATVEDVHCTLRLLMSPRCHLLAAQVLDCFYCMATFLLHWKYTVFQLSALSQTQGDRATSGREGRQSVNMTQSRSTSVVRGLHYRVFYALYLYENSFMASHAMLQQAMVTCPGQQSMVKYSAGETEMKLTHEQLRIVNYTPDLKSGENVKVFAYAGTGKTTVLLRYTQMRPHLKFLLIVFNKSICTHAQKIFPPNVTCKTGHGLAFAVTGRRYAACNQLNAGNLRVYDVAMTIRNRKKPKGNMFTHAKFVMEALKSFLSSSDEFVTTHHVPKFRISDDGRRVMLTHEEQMLCADNAEHYWGRMKNFEDTEVRMTHDGYLKLYQLRRPTLRDFDILLVDEAQDLSPALLDVIEHQRQPKIFVGDRHQQIYAFRGAVNAMEGLTAHKVFYLTKSFRFGPEIAQVANTLLENLKNETSQNIVGHGVPGTISGDIVGQLTVLCRSNYTVFTEAVKVCSSTQPSIRIAFVGGLEGLGLSILKDIYILMLSEQDRKKENLQISNKFIASFRTLADLERYAVSISDVELIGKLRIVKFYQHNLPQCLAKISARAIHSIQQADIVFSTVHKAKGLEFSTVKIMPDFLELETQPILEELQDDHRQVVHSLSEEEVNILYVAVTRAKNSLIMSSALRTMLYQMGGGCYHPMLTEKLLADGIEMKCLSSGEQFQPQRITIYRPKLTLVGQFPVAAGVLSPAELRRVDSGYACLFGNDKDSTEDHGSQSVDIDAGFYP